MQEQKNQPVVWISAVTWVLAVAMIAITGYMVLAQLGIVKAEAPQPALVAEPAQAEAVVVKLPALIPEQAMDSIWRQVVPKTVITTRPRHEPITYIVKAGDSIFQIAVDFNLKPETVLWANYRTLKDDPDTISIGQELIIPPTDGILYKWKDGDNLEKIAGDYRTSAQNILLFPGNNLDMVNPVIEAGTMVMLPGGSREMEQPWIVPEIPRGRAGVNVTIFGGGACDTSNSYGYGSGTFIFPMGHNRISGNNYWSGHLAIDFAAGLGDPVYATDGGVVVYAGSINGGYGNMVMIDHGNGYQSLYAHLSRVAIRCGASVNQGSVIGYSGSTGNSTGTHLHFEIRYFGGFVNPLSLLQ